MTDREIILKARKIAKVVGKSGYVTTFDTDKFCGLVETWWDSNSRNWVTQVKGFDGLQIGDADYSGIREHAEKDHIRLVKENS